MSQSRFTSLLGLLIMGAQVFAPLALAGLDGVQSGKSCQMRLSSDPPFWISDNYLMGRKDFENFRKMDASRSIISSIPKLSIVRALNPDIQSQLQNVNRGGNYIGVEVISVPSNSPVQHATKVGEKGFIHYRSLIRPNAGIDIGAKSNQFAGMNNRIPVREQNVYFQVKDNAFFLKMDGGKSLEKKILRLAVARENGKTYYKTQHCCLTTPAGSSSCHTNYFFDIMDESNLSVIESSMSFDPSDACSLVNFLTPLTREQLNSFRGFLPKGKLNMQVFTPALMKAMHTPRSAFFQQQAVLTPSGLMVSMNVNLANNMGPECSYHYLPELFQKKYPDYLGRPDSVCAFQATIKSFHKTCDPEAGICPVGGCRVQFGDMYAPYGANGHKEHFRGECVDIHIQRKGDDGNVYGSNFLAKRYSRERTQELIDVALRNGATCIYNDPQTHGCRNDNTNIHSNHIHMCFPSDSEQVQSACENYIQNH